MEKTALRIESYQPSFEAEWDAFIDESLNGTFLQSRRFLNYHKNRFIDDSLLFFRGGKLVCVCPACAVDESGGKTFWSHKGSTFGGLVLAEDECRAEKILEIINLLKQYLNDNGYNKAVLKITSDLFSLKSADLLEYCLWKEGFNDFCEISTYVDLAECPTDYGTIFNATRRNERNRWKKEGAYFTELFTEKEISVFYDLLANNLKKHEASPVHTLVELIDLKFERLPHEMSFYGTFLDNEMVAGCLLFKFLKAKTIHLQYMATHQGAALLPSPAAFTYGSILEKASEQGFLKASWGTSTFEQGRVLNNSLIKFKESLSNHYSQNKIYQWKRL